MNHTEDKSAHLLGLPQETKKSSLKKSSSVDQGSGLAVQGLGARQKSFVQFDDKPVVIEDAGGDAVDKKDKKDKEDKKDHKTKGGNCSPKSHRWTDSLKITKKKLGSQEKSLDEKKD
eukprot:GFUD01037305.1.p1 GENE.GFUD01037305.1~~GFUD01037305.1.p1  ORF type:complete len:117 (-),score=47.85 GFUD01037305.1:96-446(-)